MKLVLGIPVVDSVYAEVYGSHLALTAEMARAGEITLVCPLNAPSVDAGRKIIWDQAASGDYLMFVDHDVLLPPGSFSSLLESLLRRNAQVAAGRYCLRGYPYTNIWGKRVLDGKMFVDSEVEAELDGCGMGCTLIDIKWVKENLTEPLWKTTHDENGRTIETEDYYFCNKVRVAKGIIIGVPSVDCGHDENYRNVDFMKGVCKLSELLTVSAHNVGV
jgi:hypothetical protein